MSRIGKLPVSLPSGVTVTQNGSEIVIKGPKGELRMDVHKAITVTISADEIVVSRSDDVKENRALHGLTRALLNNMVIGVTEGFEKRLEVRGVGYRFSVAGNKVTLTLGYSHPIEFSIPEGITIVGHEEHKNTMIISGINKQTVGEVAAKIRSYRKPEPYKGKGIRYVDEYVAIKQGKAAAK
jgi:large subunit ribosomal protein L6